MLRSLTERRPAKRETYTIDTVCRSSALSPVRRKLCNVTLTVRSRNEVLIPRIFDDRGHFMYVATHPLPTTSRKFKRPDKAKRPPPVDVRGTTKLSAARTALQGNQGGPRLILLPLELRTDVTRHSMFRSSFILREEATFGIYGWGGRHSLCFPEGASLRASPNFRFTSSHKENTWMQRRSVTCSIIKGNEMENCLLDSARKTTETENKIVN